jgi:hypothetical protein
MVSFRDAKENLVTNRDGPFAIGQRCAASNPTFPCPRTHLHITHVNLGAWQVVARGEP